MLSRIGPRSLAGQLMLVLALALLLAQAVNLALLVRAARQERLTSIAAGAAAQIARGWGLSWAYSSSSASMLRLRV